MQERGFAGVKNKMQEMICGLSLKTGTCRIMLNPRVPVWRDGHRSEHPLHRYKLVAQAQLGSNLMETYRWVLVSL